MASYICWLVVVLSYLPASTHTLSSEAVRHHSPLGFVGLDSAGLAPTKMAAKNSNIDQKSLRMSASGIEKPNFADRGRRQIRRNHADGDSIRNVHERSVSSGSTPNTNLAVATVAYLWWQNHKDKHKQIPADDLEILYSEELLGGGAYGEVFHAVVRDEERGEIRSVDHAPERVLHSYYLSRSWTDVRCDGIRAVAKRARDGSIDPDDPAQTEPVSCPTGLKTCCG
eukprot:3695843-Rhodomonas_salina.2